MKREEYLSQLRKYLKRLPKDDYENAMEYFTEYFEEAGEEGEQKVIEELGTPKEAAGELLSNLLTKSKYTEKRKRKTLYKKCNVSLDISYFDSADQCAFSDFTDCSCGMSTCITGLCDRFCFCQWNCSCFGWHKTDF